MNTLEKTFICQDCMWYEANPEAFCKGS